MKVITRTVWILSFVSLLTDTASELLYPVLPIYLKEIGFSVIFIGILEGIAEAIIGLSKGYFGRLSDISGKRVLFVQLGYGLSAISKPLIPLFVVPIWVFFARTLDRLGKGIRTAARDALLSEEATPQTKGRIFGFHRAMDTLGAVLGSSLALVYLYFYPKDYKTLFFISFFPGILAVLLSAFLKDKINLNPQSKTNEKWAFFSFLNYWKKSSPDYKNVVIGLLVFSLLNSSDVFLLLKVKQVILNDTQVIGTYIFYNLVYALFAFPVGILADKLGLKNTLITGLGLFVVVYAGMALSNNIYVFLGLFFLYGIYAAATEGISKAWISNLTRNKDTATALGTFNALQSIMLMLASSLTGLVWYIFGAYTAFMTTAIGTLFVIFYFLTIFRTKIKS